MSKLSTKARKALPAHDFAGPGRSYPIEDVAHARNAKARASGAENAGHISPAQESRINARADQVLTKHNDKHGYGR